MAAQLLNRLQLSNINQWWSMEFVTDQRSDARLFDGRKFRSLTIAAAAGVDNFSRKCLGPIHKEMDVVEVIERIRQENGTVLQRI